MTIQRMVQLIDYLKDKQNWNELLLIIILADSVLNFSILITKNIFIGSLSNNWFGFKNIVNQMIFCNHISMIILIIVSIIFIYLIDRLIVNKIITKNGRYLFFILATLIIIGNLISHYLAISPSIFDPIWFEEAKFLVCY